MSTWPAKRLSNFVIMLSPPVRIADRFRPILEHDALPTNGKAKRSAPKTANAARAPGAPAARAGDCPRPCGLARHEGQAHLGDAGRHIEPGRALDTERLQCD